MSTLTAALQATPWRLLKIIGRRRGLHFSSNIRKAKLVSRLTRHLLAPDNLDRLLATLPAEQRRLLAELKLAGGRLPARYFQARYGLVRSTHSLIQTYYQPRRRPATDQSLLSPPEQLYLYGLIFLDPTTADLFIPADLLPHLPTIELPPPAPPTEATPEASPAELACHDLAYLLGLLRRQVVYPRHGRWLTPNILSAWGRGCRVPPAFPQARGELQTGRRRFLHYLAENAGWLFNEQLEINNEQKERQFPGAARSSLPASRSSLRALRSPLFPTPAAWLWLNASPQERLQQLWHSWSSPDPDRWRAFRLPGAAWLSQPQALLAVIHPYLPRLDPADPAQFARLLLARQPDLLDLLPATLLGPETTLVETVVHLLTGPLVWLGVLQTADSDSDRDRDSERERERERERESDGDEDSERESQVLALTAEGLAWLTSEALPAEPWPPYTKFSINSDFQTEPLNSTLTLTLQAGLPEPVDLVVALEVGSREYGVEGLKKTSPTSYSLLLTPISFILALHRGWSPPALLDALNRLADRPLTGQETALLRAWAEAAGQMTIRPATLLETTNPDIISRLASTRRGRALIHRTLSPRAVVVDPARLDLLIQRLTEQEGVPPRQIGRGNSESDSDRDRGKTDRQSSSLSHSLSLSDLWLALRVYQELGRLIRLPVRIPQQTIDALTASVPPPDLAAADIAAVQVLAALEQLSQGQTPFPPWPEDGLPIEQSLPIIEEALASGQALELHYYAASTDTVTRRLVEPYRLEWHGDVPYLIGFCHRAQAERMFRLDRIQRIGIAESNSDRDRGQIETSESDSEGEGRRGNWTEQL